MKRKRGRPKKKRVHIARSAVVFTLCSIFFLLAFILPSFWPQIIAQPNVHIEQATTTIKPDTRPGNLDLVRVEIVITDDTSKVEGKVTEVVFNNYKIELRPADPAGRRGRMHFQMEPGKYKISWKVQNTTYAWPRESSYSKTIELTENDKWVHILISGREIFIS